MSSSYSPDLRIELITTGEQAGVWGYTTNSNFTNVIEQAIAGYVSVPVTSTNYLLTYANGGSTNGALNQSGYAAIALAASGIGSDYNVYVPKAPKLYVFYNAGGFTATVYVSSSTGTAGSSGKGVLIPSGKVSAVWSDGTDMHYQNDSLATLNIVGADSTGYLSAPPNGLYLSSANNLCISTNSTKAITFNSSQNADMGTGVTVDADRYFQTVNASTGTSASASLLSKSVTQTIQLTTYSPLHSNVGGVSVGSKSTLRVSGAAGGLYIWDASTSPTITFLVGSTATTAGAIDASGNWSFNSKTLSSATWNGAAIGIAYGGTNGSATPTANGVAYGTGSAYAFTGAGTTGQVLKATTSNVPSWGAVTLTSDVTGVLPALNGGTGVNNGSSTITIGGNVTFSGASTFAGTLTGNTSVTFPTSGTLATTAGTVNSLAGGNATFAPFSDNTNFLYGYTIQHTSASGPTAGPTLKFVNAAGTGIATITGNSTGFGFGNSSGSYTLPVYAYSFVSAASTGTAPFTVSSTSIVNNLNVQYLNGKQSTDFLLSSTAVTPAQGGTGVANGSSNTLTFSGNYPLALTLSGSTSLTMPTSGTVVSDGGWTSYTPVVYTLNGSTYTVVSSGTYRVARYKVIGSMVYVQFYVNFLGGTGTGDQVVMSLPVASPALAAGFPANSNYISSGMVNATYNLSTSQTAMPYPNPSTSYLFFVVPYAGSFPIFMTMPGSGGGTIYGTFSYSAT